MENEGFREMPKYSMSQCRVCLAWVMNDPCSKRLHCGSLTHRAMVLWVQPGKRSWASCLQEASAPAPSTEEEEAGQARSRREEAEQEEERGERFGGGLAGIRNGFLPGVPSCHTVEEASEV